MKRKQKRPERKTVNLLLLDGGVGDHIASLVAVDYAIKRYPFITFLTWVPNYLLDLARHLIPNANIRNFTDLQTQYDHNLPTKTTKWDGITSSMKIHLLDYAFLKLLDENPSIEHKNYLKIRPDEIPVTHSLPDKYVVVTAGYTAKAREFPAHHVNKVVRFVKSKGYEAVFLGQTKTDTGIKHKIEGNFDQHLNLKLGINLINETTLLEAAKIMHHAKAVVGVDNGLLHVAGCTNTAIVGGFTSVSPEIRMPVRNNILGYNFYPIVPEPSIGCCQCQEKTNFLYGHDYRSCIYDDRKCVEAMSSDKFIAKLDQLLYEPNN